MDEVIAALLAVPTILVGILVMVTVVEGADRSRQLQTATYRGALAAASGVPADATPADARAGSAAASAAVLSAAWVCADRPTVTVDYYSRRDGAWLDPARYQGNTGWAGTPPVLSRVRVSVRCWPLPGPLPAMAYEVTRTSQVMLAEGPPLVEEAPATDPLVGQLQEER